MDEIDILERQAHEALAQIRLEYERAAAPYIKILCDLAALRPRVIYVMNPEGNIETHVPITANPPGAAT
jgi:hypothetical protein